MVLNFCLGLFMFHLTIYQISKVKRKCKYFEIDRCFQRIMQVHNLHNYRLITSIAINRDIGLSDLDKIVLFADILQIFDETHD